MENVNLAIVYYSATGTNYQLAKWAEETAKNAGANVRLVKVQELAPDVAIDSNPAWRKHADATAEVEEANSEDLEWADAVIFSYATRFGNMASQMKQFLDLQGGLWASGKLVNKVVSGMSSAQNDHGGQEAALLSLYTSMMHWGAIIAAPGYTDPVLFTTGGNPYGTTVTVDADGNMQRDVKPAVEVQTKRVLDIASRIKAGN